MAELIVDSGMCFNNIIQGTKWGTWAQTSPTDRHKGSLQRISNDHKICHIILSVLEEIGSLLPKLIAISSLHHAAFDSQFKPFFV